MSAAGVLDAPAPPESAAAPADAPAQRDIPAALRSTLPTDTARGRWVTAAVVAVAALTRLWDVSFPPGKIFDEAYYATEAQEMLRYGYEDNRGYMFIVHPPLGKWLIGLGSWLFGDNSLGWRIIPAVAGILCVLLLTRITRRITGSTLLGGIAGLLLAIEGMSVVLSRTALLDIFLPLFLLGAFGAFVLDRDQLRGRLATLLADGADLSGGCPALGPRPWRLIGGACLGLSLAVKWSAASFVVAFILLDLWWDRGALKAAGVRRPALGALRRSVPYALGSLVIAPLGVYLATWTGWFVGESGWNRYWAAQGGQGIGFRAWWAPSFLVDHLPGPLRSLINYHYNAYQFHVTLHSAHAYGSSPWSWLVLGRPVSLYYVGDQTGCGAATCAREVVLLGTPLMWWAFVPATLWCLWHWATTRDWRAEVVLVAFVAGWAVWLREPKRTMFLFYMAPLVPFLILGVTLAIGVALRTDIGRPLRRYAIPDPIRAAPVPDAVFPDLPDLPDAVFPELGDARPGALPAGAVPTDGAPTGAVVADGADPGGAEPGGSGASAGGGAGEPAPAPGRPGAPTPGRAADSPSLLVL
ncbi:MAG: phospholipid carrier-dependent glycosyltransferase, partial [Frankiaceae bacterium]|nr:phospholipid carrier-dependent glycosyltransferase [Frankiaceae bacterium]